MASTPLPGTEGPVAKPHRMPVDAEVYRSDVSLTHFINGYYQVRDALSFAPRRVLVVGVGVGIEPILFREKYGLEVTTLDIDERFGPDVLGSVHDLSAFEAGRFDVAIASHVLEHLPFPYFEDALRELARVARNAVVYLPYGGRHLEWRFTYAQRFREYALKVRIPPLRRVTGRSLDLQSGEHYWEVGFPGFSVAEITRVITRYFTIKASYQNPDWKYSYNFVLISRAHTATP